MEDAKANIVLYPNKRLAVLVILVGFAMVGVAVAYIVNHINGDPRAIVGDIIMVLAVLFFTFSSLSQLVMVFSTQPAVVVDSRGIRITTGLLGAGLITWDEIAGLMSLTVLTARFFTIIPWDLNAILARQPLIPRVWMFLTAKTSPTPINVPQAWLLVPADELVQRISQEFATEIHRYHIGVRITPE
jgi:hypothetical protein